MATLTFMTHTIFDHGASQRLGRVLAQHGIERPLLCTDPGLVGLGLVTDLVGALGNEPAPTVFDGTPENPTQALENTATTRITGIRSFDRRTEGILAANPLRSADVSICFT